VSDEPVETTDPNPTVWSTEGEKTELVYVAGTGWVHREPEDG
jgi:hypothetical protein